MGSLDTVEKIRVDPQRIKRPVISFRYTHRNENFILVAFAVVATTAECWQGVVAKSGLGFRLLASDFHIPQGYQGACPT